jgi:NAD(P)-dependent dehydrogenase (short-subunit alcohol dehydrogenase family)
MRTHEALAKRFSLDGQRGLVTGGSGGLGLAMARTLAEAGATVFALSRTGAVKESAPQRTPPAEGLHHVQADVTDRTRCRAVVREIGEDGGLNFLINNAGVNEHQPAAQTDPQTWRRVQRVNTDAVFAMCQLAYPYLKDAPEGGRIVNVASMAAHLGFAGAVPYAASKSAVQGITRSLAVEWAPDGLLVNSVSPGWFPSGQHRELVTDELEEKILGRMPMHRYGEPEELASAVLFLVSPAASYITGQDLAIDGGALAFGY